jgi:hypothetical protein
LENLLCKLGYLDTQEDKLVLTKSGEDIGGESKFNKFKKGGIYFVWPETILNSLS